MSTENSSVPYTLVFSKEGNYPRFAESELLFLGKSMPISSLQVMVDNKSEYLLVKIPLHKVEILSESSEPLDKA